MCHRWQQRVQALLAHPTAPSTETTLSFNAVTIYFLQLGRNPQSPSLVELTSPTASEGFLSLVEVPGLPLIKSERKIPSVPVHTMEEINAETPWTLLCRREGQVIT